MESIWFQLIWTLRLAKNGNLLFMTHFQSSHQSLQNITTIMVYTNILGMTLLSQVQPEQEKFGILNYYRVGQVNFQKVLAQQIFS